MSRESVHRTWALMHENPGPRHSLGSVVLAPSEGTHPSSLCGHLTPLSNSRSYYLTSPIPNSDGDTRALPTATAFYLPRRKPRVHTCNESPKRHIRLRTLLLQISHANTVLAARMWPGVPREPYKLGVDVAMLAHQELDVNTASHPIKSRVHSTVEVVLAVVHLASL